MQKLLIWPVFIAALFLSFSASSQTVEELKAQKAAKEAQIATLQGEANAIQKQLDDLPGWDLGTRGTLGANFSQFSDWVSTDNPNTFASTIGFAGSAFANLDQPGYFWKNGAALTLAKTKLDTDTEDNTDADYETSADAFNVSSLYGKKLSEKFAISSLAEYRTTILSNFNNPGFLDVGAGATWLPVQNMVVVFHPLNYNFVFSKNNTSYESSLGCKIVVDYARTLPRGIGWKSNLSTFVSYQDVSNLSNWMWTNGLSLTIWKGLGVGLDFALRSNKQEGYNYFLKQNPTLDPAVFPIDDLDSDDNPLQTYWILGFTYNL